MARIRTIKPEFPQSESMGNVSREARLLFILLWPFCDDHGKARGSSRLLASLLYPYDKDVPDLIDGWFDELVRERCVIRYEVEGAHYVKVTKWLEHQKIDRPSASKFPDPSEGSILIAKPREPSSEDQGSRTEGRDQGPGAEEAAAADDGLKLLPALDRSVDKAFGIWNARATEHGWPIAQMLNSTRRWSIQQRLDECGGIDGWRAALDAAATSQFITGTDGKPQRWFDLDWTLKPENFTRLMEGRYAERHRDKTAVQHGGESPQPDGISAAFARRSVLAGG